MKIIVGKREDISVLSYGREMPMTVGTIAAYKRTGGRIELILGVSRKDGENPAAIAIGDVIDAAAKACPKLIGTDNPGNIASVRACDYNGERFGFDMTYEILLKPSAKASIGLEG